MDEVRDPVHQFIQLTPLELALIDSRPFQRLRDIHQLSLSYLVWPGATHTRFEHSLGTMELAGRAFDIAMSNADPTLLRNLGLESLSDRGRARNYVRFGALLHDVGHTPFSHGSEEVFPDGFHHEQMTSKLITESDLHEILTKAPVTARVDSHIVADIAVGPEYREIDDPQVSLLAELVTGGVGVDRWDYLLRDSLYTGVQYGVFDVYRLLQTLTLAELNGSPVWALEAGGQYIAEQMLLSRWFMSLNVYYHKTRRILDRHLVEFLRQYLPGETFPTAIDEFLNHTDSSVIAAIRADTEHTHLILEREHYSLVREFTRDEFTTDGNGVFDDEAFDTFCDSVEFDDLKTDVFSISISPPGESNFYVLDQDGHPQSLIEALPVARTLSRPQWIGRIYAPRKNKEAALRAVRAAYESWEGASNGQ